MSEPSSEPRELSVGPCCRKDKSLWIGIGSLIGVITLFSVFYFKLIVLEFPNISQAWFYFYGGHIAFYVIISALSCFGIWNIKEYCKSVKTDKNITDLFLGLFILGIVAISAIWFTSQIHHDYLDAELYNTNIMSKLSIINSMSCQDYLQFYDEKLKAFVHYDRIVDNGPDTFELGLLGLCGKP